MQNFLQSRVVVVGQTGLEEFPKVICTPGQHISYGNSTNEMRNIFEVQNNRRQFFLSRLSMIEEAVFSHSDMFMKPKLTDTSTSTQNQDKMRVYNVHAVVGQTERIYVLGILTQREDTHFYLEDSTYSIRLGFTDLQYADPECFFTEN